MERKITSFLKKWQKDILRKPLVIYGAKQIGKTYTILSFGRNEYKNVVYFNTENNKKIKELFSKEKSTEKIILNLSLLSGETILKDDTLIIFDNVNDLEIVKGIKIFGSEKSKYHIILISSKKDNLTLFKGEELQFKNMYEMDFEEYLWARDEKSLAELIKESYKKHKTCPFHKIALELFQEYIVTGGYPEVIRDYINGTPEYEIDAIKQKIIDCIIKETTNQSNLIDIQRAIEVIKSIPEQLIKDNKKFQYGLIGEGKRAKEYENSINYLVNNQLLYRSYKILDVRSPLSSCREKESFKLYMTDDGLLLSMLHMNSKDILKDEQLKETLYENHIAKSLTESGYSLYYYQSKGKAEVNFVIQNRMGKIIPIEITTKIQSKAKSLSVFMKNHTTLQAYRITENNFSTKKDIRYIPIYASFCIENNEI